MELDIYLTADEIKDNRLCSVPDELYYSNLSRGISRSTVDKALTSPSKFFLEQKETEAMRLGSAFHSYILEPNVFYRDYHFLGSEYDRKRQTTIEKDVLSGALPSGKYFIRSKDERWMRAVKAEAKRHLPGGPLLNLDKKFVECSVFTTLPQYNQRVKVKADIVDVYNQEIIELKTIATGKKARSEFINRNYDLQAFFYKTAFDQALDADFTYKIMFFEKTHDGPLIEVFIVSDESLEYGEAKMNRGINSLNRIIECRELDQAYSPSDKEQII